MAPFLDPTPVLKGFKERIESLTLQGDRLYIGSATGNLHVYEVGNIGTDVSATLSPVEVKQGFSRRAIEQLGFLKDVNALVALSEATVTLYPLPNIGPPTPLAKARGALCFAVQTSVQQLLPGGKSPNPAEGDFAQKTVPSAVTYLVIGCKRRVVLYSWKDGEPQDVKEIASLPHSPRCIAFVTPTVICMASQGNYTNLDLITMTVTEVSMPAPPTTATSYAGMGMGMGALTGLFASKAKPTAITISEGEVLLPKDSAGLFVGADGKETRQDKVDWPAPPEEIAFVKPYVFSILPPSTVPAPVTNESGVSLIALTYPTSVIQIRSSLTQSTTQTLPYPFNSTAALTAADNHSVRLLTSSAGARAPLFLVSSPTERAALAADGHTVWAFRMRPWGEQVDELIAAESYDAALALLNSLDAAILPDKAARQTLVKGLAAIARFRAGEFEPALEALAALDVAPAKVIALFPPAVAGRLASLQSEWIPLFGGPRPPPARADSGATEGSGPKRGEGEATKDEEKKEGVSDGQSRVRSGSVMLGGRTGSPMGSIRGSVRAGLDAIIPSLPSALRDDDTASIRSVQKEKMKDRATQQSILSLMPYLTDRRTKIYNALAALQITPAQATKFAPLSETSVADILALPDVAASALTPEQLVRSAQVVDTALFKSYLQVRPGLVGSLCRIENWCEVGEVEEELQAREKFSDLKDLYYQRNMHTKALELLKRQSERETDKLDKLQPSVTYLQRLGPQYLDQIFASSRWVLEQDVNIGFQIFTSEEVELPRERVADFMESFDPRVCAHYLEYLINERKEEDAYFHDRLAELYLKMTLAAKKKGDKDAQQDAYGKLLAFIDTTDHYHTDRLYGLLPSEDLFEARAILLGRLGRHEHALELYIYRLHDYIKAEEYCKRIYQPDGPTSSAYLWLLRIFLRPTTKTGVDLLQPALALIGRHSPRIDPAEAMDLLPPLVTAADARRFLMEALRAPILDTRVRLAISKARDEQLARKLVALQTRRVKVTDSRICPQCHRRLGGSVIAVHLPRGEVTHYNCREAFVQRLKGTRL